MCNVKYLELYSSGDILKRFHNFIFTICSKFPLELSHKRSLLLCEGFYQLPHKLYSDILSRPASLPDKCLKDIKS